MRIIRAQINWPRTEYSSLILLKDFFNNIDPKLTIAGFRAYGRASAPEVLELYVTGLRLAGLPEK